MKSKFNVSAHWNGKRRKRNGEKKVNDNGNNNENVQEFEAQLKNLTLTWCATFSVVFARAQKYTRRSFTMKSTMTREFSELGKRQFTHVQQEVTKHARIFEFDSISLWLIITFTNKNIISSWS